MDKDEKIAFYEEISNRGYMIRNSDEGGVLVHKIGKVNDDGSMEHPMMRLLSTRDDAIALIKGLINWEYKPVMAPPPVIEVKSDQGMEFKASIMFDLDRGYPPECVDLGVIKDCDSVTANQIAESRALEHFEKYIPKANFAETKKQIRLLPVLQE